VSEGTLHGPCLTFNSFVDSSQPRRGPVCRGGWSFNSFVDSSFSVMNKHNADAWCTFNSFVDSSAAAEVGGHRRKFRFQFFCRFFSNASHKGCSTPTIIQSFNSFVDSSWDDEQKRLQQNGCLSILL